MISPLKEIFVIRFSKILGRKYQKFKDNNFGPGKNSHLQNLLKL